MILLLFISLFLGFSYLCLGIKKHSAQAAIIHQPDLNNRQAIALGSFMLTISFIFSLYFFGIGVGFVYYLGLATLTHLLVIIFLHYRPKLLSIIIGYPRLFRLKHMIK